MNRSRFTAEWAQREAEHKIYTQRWREQIPYGTDYKSLDKAYIADKARSVYKDAPDILEETLGWLSKL